MVNLGWLQLEERASALSLSLYIYIYMSSSPPPPPPFTTTTTTTIIVITTLSFSHLPLEPNELCEHTLSREARTYVFTGQLHFM